MRILFKYPTRSRVNWFKSTLKKYYDMMSKGCDFRFLVTLDEDDLSMNNADVRTFLDRQVNLTYKYGVHRSKIEACNADIDLVREWDILVLVSDDMIPVVKDYDKIIVDTMTKHFSDTDGALHFNDGCCGRDTCITLSIIGKKLYDRFGYIYHPAYKSFYCDSEFTNEVYRMKKVIYVPRVIIRHKWSGGPKSKDALYRRNSKMGGPDKETYNRRKLLDFPRENSWSM